MLTRLRYLRVVITLCALLWPLTNTVNAQNSAGELQRILREKAAFDAADFVAVEQGQTVVRLSPLQDKKEIALSGIVSVRANVDEFLKSYREGLTQKNHPAVMEIGRFESVPALSDLKDLTIDSRDIEDLKECVVGDCQLRLSAPMIERFRNEVNWQAPDYQVQATQLFKTMLVDYVRDYVARGDAALIEYSDKRDEVRVAEEQKVLTAATGYLNDLLPGTPLNNPPPGMHLIEQAIVWSKVKLGLKPVLMINHITIYEQDRGQDRNMGPQVLIASRQLYANHYFNSSLALTAFVIVPGATPEAYLVYENRSRSDALQGLFSKFKRRMVESKALDGVKAILEYSKLSLEGSGFSVAAETTAQQSTGWRHRLFGGIRPVLWVLIVSGLFTLLVLGRRRAEARPARRPVALSSERR
jgi:hypothetical protein